MIAAVSLKLRPMSNNLFTYIFRLFQGPSLDMANQFANIMNLMMSAIFFHSMLPLAIPIACVGLFANYWSNKVLYLSS